MGLGMDQSVYLVPEGGARQDPGPLDSQLQL